MLILRRSWDRQKGHIWAWSRLAALSLACPLRACSACVATSPRGPPSPGSTPSTPWCPWSSSPGNWGPARTRTCIIFTFRLDPESKNSEIHRLLPLLGPFAQDFAGIHNKLSKAFVKLEDIDAIKEAVCLQNRNRNNNNNYIEDLQENASAPFLNDDNSSYSYLSMKPKPLTF